MLLVRLVLVAKHVKCMSLKFWFGLKRIYIIFLFLSIKLIDLTFKNHRRPKLTLPGKGVM